MTPLDWTVVAAYAALLVGVGLWKSRRARGGTEAYFASGRSLPWWLAGTSMIAASFATDTPLVIAGGVRTRGIWGNWFWWSLGISTILSGFLFARLWRRSGVLTEPELTELRYAGRAASFLRGVKSVYWGVLYNAYAAGALQIASLALIAESLAGIDRREAVFLCAGVSLAYSVTAGLWGVVSTDFLQFCAAVAGSVLMTVFSVRAAGGWEAVRAALPAGHAGFLPDLSVPAEASFWTSDAAWLLAFLGVQWWAWKNTDGGGVLVQRMVSCRDERQAVLAMLWYNTVHYALRAWPWIVVGAASLVVLPGLAVSDAAYPEMIRAVLPAGVKGFVVAWFFAEFVASLSGSVNWGASLVVNDLYRRFVRPQRTDAHYLKAGRAASVLIMAGAVACALAGGGLLDAFQNILHLTAGVGVVQMARWLWWRVSAAGEIAAMIASPFCVFWADDAARLLGVPEGSLLFRLLFTVVGSACVWIPAVFLFPEPGRTHLKRFFFKVKPPGPGWKGLFAGTTPGIRPFPLRRELAQWGVASVAVFAMNFGIGSALFGSGAAAAGLLALSAVAWLVLLRMLKG